MRKQASLIRPFSFSIHSLFFSRKRVIILFSMLVLLSSIMYRFLFGENSIHNFVAHLYRNIKPEIERAAPDNLFELSDCKYCNTDFYKGVKNSTLKVELRHADFISMMEERKRGLNEALLGSGQWLKSPRTFHEATIKYDNSKKLEGKVKLIGMNPDQYGASSFYSFRVKMSKDNRIEHQKLFNILTPASRSFTKDFLANMVYQKLSEGIRINYTPVDIIINKQYQGTYLKEDFFSKFIIENNKYRESFIFESEFGNENPTQQYASYTLNYINTKDKSSKLLSDTLLSWFRTKNSTKLFPLFSYEKVVALLAVSILNNSFHNLIFINNHWYYNPVINKLEPTLRELNTEKYTFTQLKDLESNNRYAFYKGFIMNSPIIFKEYVSYLENHHIDFYRDLDESVYQGLLNYQSVLKGDEYINFVKHLGIRNARYVSRGENVLNSAISIFSESFKQKPFIKKHKNTIKKIQITKDIDIAQSFTVKKEEELIVHKGCKINLYKGANLIIYGKITVLGEKNEPVIFSAKDTFHSSVFINTDSTTHNSFSYTQFEKLSSLKEEIWHTTASITVYQSPVFFDNCTFKENREGDDFINLFRVNHFEIKHSTFFNTLSDAIDTDFSTGKVSNCSFSDIGNDAIDGSGSDITITNCVIDCASDKAISSGENSRLWVSNTQIKNCAIGLVSKDFSHLIVENVIFTENKLDLCVFQKKPEFGVATLTVDAWKDHYNYLFQKSSIIHVKEGRMNNFTFIKDVESKLYGNEYGKASK